MRGQYYPFVPMAEIAGPFWGYFESTSVLPNVSGSTLTSSNLRAGAEAVVADELYICTSPTYGAATWAKVASAGETITTLTTSGAVTVGGTLGVTGATTLTGGLVGTTPRRITNIPIGGVAYGSVGTDVGAADSGDIFFSEIWIPANKTLTGAAVLNGATVGTDKWIYALATSTGTVVATTDLAGTTTAGADTFQQIAFTAPYNAVGPARYWLILQANGATDRFQAVAASTYLLDTGTDAAGVFGTLATITPTTSFTADIGPIGYVYT